MEYFFFFTYGFPWPLPPLRQSVFQIPPKQCESKNGVAHWHWQEPMGLLGAQFLSLVRGSVSCLAEWHMVSEPQVKGTFSPTSAYMSCTFRFARAIWTAQRLAWKLWFELFSKGQRPLSQLSTRPAAQARWGPFLPLSLSSSSPFLPSFLPALLSKLRSS